MNIDQGKAILIYHAIGIIQKNKPAQIFTGDKKFIKALAKVDLPIIQNTLHHQLWCLEQLILKNFEGYGFEIIRDFIVPVRACDKAINAIFGSGDQSTSDNALYTLNAYIKKLRNETGSLLNPYLESSESINF